MLRNDWWQAALLATAIVGLGTLDYLSGPDIGFSLFYLAPVAWSGWYLPAPASLSLALVATACWLGADFGWHGVNLVSLWNGFVRFGIYFSVAWLTSQVRRDQGELRALNDRLKSLLDEEQHLARTDSLTGLPNRRLFLDKLREAGAHSLHSGDPLALAYIDFVNFKAVNDRFGHAAGDALLKRVGSAIAEGLATGSVAARLGGDDFAVLLGGCTEDVARVMVTRLHERLTAALADDRFSGLGVSIGMACFDAPGYAPEALIDYADAAMYCARAQGSGSIYVMRMPGRQSAG